MGKNSKKEYGVIKFKSPLYELRSERSKKTKSGRLKKLSQSDLAELVNANYNTYGLWERGETYPETENLIQLAQFFEVSTDYILGRTGCRNIGNKEIKEATGLSEKAIEVLRFLNTPTEYSDDNAEHHKTIEFINLALEEAYERINAYRTNLHDSSGETYPVFQSESDDSIIKHLKNIQKNRDTPLTIDEINQIINDYDNQKIITKSLNLHSPVTTIFSNMMKYLNAEKSELRLLKDQETIILSSSAKFEIDGDTKAFQIEDLARTVILDYIQEWLDKRKEGK